MVKYTDLFCNVKPTLLALDKSDLITVIIILMCYQK